MTVEATRAQRRRGGTWQGRVSSSSLRSDSRGRTKLPSPLPFLTENVKRHCSVSSSASHSELLSLVRRPIQAFAMVDVVVTTTGGIEEDLIKCLAPTSIGDFSLPGVMRCEDFMFSACSILGFVIWGLIVLFAVSFINGVELNELKECDSCGYHGEDDGVDSRARSRCAILGNYYRPTYGRVSYSSIFWDWKTLRSAIKAGLSCSEYAARLL
ncbi:hypothetical protein V8G54_036771, partial [Vigna mungo]